MDERLRALHPEQAQYSVEQHAERVASEQRTLPRQSVPSTGQARCHHLVESVCVQRGYSPDERLGRPARVEHLVPAERASAHGSAQVVVASRREESALEQRPSGFARRLACLDDRRESVGADFRPLQRVGPPATVGYVERSSARR
jgi:hypothetical protein